VALTVGIILITGLIVGGLFWAKESGEQARREEAIKIAEQNLQDQSDTDVALNGDTTEPSTGNTETQTPPENTDDQQSTSATITDVSELPQTGPADSAMFIAVGALTFATVSYYRSRRTLLESL
jgi:LPXTG-motif cell wall-anchored protein